MDITFQHLDIILLGGAALYLIFRLRRVLGQRHGEEGRKINPFVPPVQAPAPEVKPAPVVMPAESEEDLPHTLSRGLVRLEKADPSFHEKEFLRGAREAFRIIVTAFAAGDTATLHPLLSPSVFNQFKAAIDRRLTNGETQETQIVAMRHTDFNDVRLDGLQARIVVQFDSRQINVRRNKEGTLIDGHPTRHIDKTDVWTFSRNISSPDPNWLLVGTGSSN